MEMLNKTIEQITEKQKDLEIFKSLVTNLMQWISQLDFDISYHKEKLKENPNNEYHKEQLKRFTEIRNKRIKMAQYVADGIVF